MDVKLKMNLDVQINLKLQNVLMLLKRCCNHPYLIEYPLDPATGEYKVHTHTHTHAHHPYLIEYPLNPATGEYEVHTQTHTHTTLTSLSNPGTRHGGVQGVHTHHPYLIG